MNQLTIPLSRFATARSGDEVMVEPGRYDVGCFLRQGGVRADMWLDAKNVDRPTELDTSGQYGSIVTQTYFVNENNSLPVVSLASSARSGTVRS